MLPKNSDKKMSEYKQRIADQLLAEQLDTTGAVLVQGPKWCGKTTTAAQAAKSVLYMDDPETKENNLLLADSNVKALLEGATPRLIDEWQIATKLWDAARFMIDRRNETGQFIFTGSAVPADTSTIFHSGTGRFAWLTMRPMSLFESGESNGSMSLHALFEGKAEAVSANNLTLQDLAFLVCRGGWPGTLRLQQKSALRQAYNYIEAVANSDISRVDGVSRDASFAKRLMRSYARHQGAQVPISTICKDLQENENQSMSEDTIASYLNALRKIFVVEDMPAWNPNLRSKTAIRTSDTRYFVDPSVAAAALGLGPDDLMKDLNTFGLLFETLAVRDLRVFADALGGELFHYRDKNGLECDAVIHLRNGRYGLIEIKLGGDKLIGEGVKTLNSLAEKIDTEKMPEPSFKMVLTGIGQYAFQCKDGVYIVPIGSLRP